MSLQFYKPNQKSTGTACSFWRNAEDNTFWASLIKQDSWNAKARTGSFSKNKDNPKKRVIVKFSDTEIAGFIDAIERNAEYSGYHGNSPKQIVKYNFQPYYKGEETEELGEVKGEVNVSNDKTELKGSLNGKLLKTKPTQVGFSLSVNKEDKEDSTNKQNYLMGFYYPEAMRLKIYLKTILAEGYSPSVSQDDLQKLAATFTDRLDKLERKLKLPKDKSDDSSSTEKAEDYDF